MGLSPAMSLSEAHLQRHGKADNLFHLIFDKPFHDLLSRLAAPQREVSDDFCPWNAGGWQIKTIGEPWAAVARVERTEDRPTWSSTRPTWPPSTSVASGRRSWPPPDASRSARPARSAAPMCFSPPTAPRGASRCSEGAERIGRFAILPL